jgi:hypothetical protein
MCKDWLRLSVTVAYQITSESIARALRDQPLLNARLVSLGSDVSGVEAPVQVTGPTWDYASFAGENALLVNYSCLVEYEAIRPEAS